MPDRSDAERLAALRLRIEAERRKHEPDAPGQTHHDQAHMAWRMVIELVAGIGVGFAIGIGLDELFGTGPFLLVTFTLLGFAAGVRTMLRTATEMQQRQVREAADEAKAKEDERRG